MKRLILSLLAIMLSTFTLTHAQGIGVGDRFYDGSVVYTVREVRMGRLSIWRTPLGTKN